MVDNKSLPKKIKRKSDAKHILGYPHPLIFEPKSRTYKAKTKNGRKVLALVTAEFYIQNDRYFEEVNDKNMKNPKTAHKSNKDRRDKGDSL